MNYQVMVCLQLVYIVPSLLMYFVEVCYIIYSKDVEYSSAFYYIFLARAPADMLQVLVSLIAFRLPLTGWIYVLDKPYIAKIGYVGSNYLFQLELFTQLILSVNRFTAIFYPWKCNRFWTLRNTIILFALSSVLAMTLPITRLHLEASYIDVGGKTVLYITDQTWQKRNSYISSCAYMFFGVTCFVLNIASLIKHSQQGNTQFFDKRQDVAQRVQSNLLVYSFLFTMVIISMTIFQGMLALEVFPSKSDGYSSVVIMLTFTADTFALSNPWLLIALSKSFRSRFLKTASAPSALISVSAITRATEGPRRNEVFYLKG